MPDRIPDDVDMTALDPDQRSSELAKDLPRARLSPAVIAVLWLLRVYAVVAIALVVYVFVRSLRG